jgi:hypothetical protein
MRVDSIPRVINALERAVTPRFIVSLAILVALVPITGGAQTIDDQLTDRSWSSFAHISHGVTVEKGALRIQSVVGQPGESGLITKCRLAGDFEVQVNYYTLDWPPQNGHSVGLAADDIPSQSSPTTLFTSFAAGLFRTSMPATRQELYSLLTGDANPQRGTTDSAGTLRLVRRGITVMGYSGAASGWTLIGAGSGNALPTQISIRLSRKLPTTTGVSVAFDNFNLTAGRVLCPPS